MHQNEEVYMDEIEKCKRQTEAERKNERDGEWNSRKEGTMK